jgi:hypothetical protein
MIAHILTNNGINFVISGQPYNVPADHARFDELVTAIKEGRGQDALDILERTARLLEKKVLSYNLTYDNGIVRYKGEQVHGYVVDKLILAINEQDESGIEYIVNFLERVQNNPSNSVIEHLYKFLEHGGMPITANGKFWAYKAVRHDFKDIHSGTISNHVGAVCKMPRNRVDDRRDVTCSHGLHVCSYDYLRSFAQGDGHVMICEVDPADVVAIPSDYNDTKMRVAQYTVVGEVTDYYKRDEDVLATTAVVGSYTLHGVYDDHSGETDLDLEFESFEEAREAADNEFSFGTDEDGDDWHSVLVRNTFGDVVYTTP